MNTIVINEQMPVDKIKNYYNFHAYIYDITRWTFLFGRKKIIRSIPFLKNDVKKVIEIGCGTGYNLISLANAFPNATIIGIDISEDMVEKAQKNTAMYPNIIIRNESFPSDNKGDFDLVLMSYVLTMMNPGWKFWINAAKELLNSKGYFVVVDFHSSSFTWFRNHMGNHHVKMNAHLLPELNKNYKSFNTNVKNAYFGVWQYFMFIGRKR